MPLMSTRKLRGGAVGHISRGGGKLSKQQHGHVVRALARPRGRLDVRTLRDLALAPAQGRRPTVEDPAAAAALRPPGVDAQVVVRFQHPRHPLVVHDGQAHAHAHEACARAGRRNQWRREQLADSTRGSELLRKMARHMRMRMKPAHVRGEETSGGVNSLLTAQEVQSCCARWPGTCACA